MSKMEYFYYVKNKFDKFPHLACIRRKSKRCGLWLPWGRNNSETTQIQKVTEYQYLPIWTKKNQTDVCSLKQKERQIKLMKF